MFVYMCHSKPSKHLKLIGQILTTNILIVFFFLNFILIFKCYVPWHLSSYVCMNLIYHTLKFSQYYFAQDIYPPVDLSLKAMGNL
jgi:hypothetical protein